MKRNILIVFVAFFIVQIRVAAQRETAIRNLLLNKGAVPTGFAGAYTAIAEGAHAMFYNPAGLTQTTNLSGFVSYMDFKHDFSDDWFAIHSAANYHVDEIGNFGIGVHYLNTGKNYQDKKDDYDLEISAGYGRKLTENISVGTTIKYIHSVVNTTTSSSPDDILTFDANAIAFDFGVLFKNLLCSTTSKGNLGINIGNSIARNGYDGTGISIGITVSNIGNQVYYFDEDQKDPLPQNMRLGLAWNLLDTDLLGFRLSSDIRKIMVHRERNDSDGAVEALFTSWKGFKWNELAVSLGFEVEVTRYFAFRMGWFYEDPSYRGEKYYTYGVSINSEFVSFNLSVYDDKTKRGIMGNTIVFEGSFSL